MGRKELPLPEHPENFTTGNKMRAARRKAGYKLKGFGTILDPNKPYSFSFLTTSETTPYRPADTSKLPTTLRSNHYP